MKPPGLAPAGDEHGFILVGVVMFMIALTILGLSLFALSSYEAQFFYASQSREQSLQSSESGLELVKALLAAPNARLDDARLAVGQFGVTRALAYQARSSNPNDTTSRGPVNWDSTLVIVVAAQTGGEEREVQSRFVPAAIKNPYQQLISCGGRLWYNPQQDDNATTLRGGVWQHVQSDADSEWTNHVSWPAGRPIDTGSPPALSANAFVDAHRSPQQVWELESDDIDLSGTSYALTMDEAPSNKPFYKLPANSSPVNLDGYELYCDKPLTIRIHGTVIWLVSQGVCFKNTVKVVPSDPSDPTPSVLVIVAKPNPNDTNDPNRGIWFQGGLVNDSTTTRVFLVSDGDISYTQDFNGDKNLEAQALTIVAGGDVELMGPDRGGTLKFGHAAVMNPLADDLLTSGLLPATNGGTGKTLKYAWHSWLETRLP